MKKVYVKIISRAILEIDDDITVEEFQKLLDNAKNTIIETLNKIEKDEI